MAGMPEMQEQFSAMAMDGRYAGNAGAIFGNTMDGRYAGNAGAIFGNTMARQSNFRRALSVPRTP